MNRDHLARPITAGVDTHLDVHVVAALDAIGGLLGVESFPANAAGYRRLLGWLQSFATVVLVGVEGTGSCSIQNSSNRMTTPLGSQAATPERHL